MTGCEERACSIRRTVVEASRRANVGHIGSCLSVADLIATLYGGILRGAGTDDPERDRFVLSKGHAALTLYAALAEIGVLTAEDLVGFCGDATPLGAHPEHLVPGVDFSSGSLGLGLSIGAGAALAARLDASARRVFVLMSDAECNEGSVWEAAMFAAHHRLAHLVAIIDANGQQALGYTADVLDLEPLGERWRAFGWDVLEVDGHDCGAIAAALTPHTALPRVVIARTTFGKGVSFMESRLEWHYLPLNENEYHRALDEVNGALA
jgi:transketolase